MTLEQLNGLSDDEARNALARCCGSRRWLDGMLAARPFRDHRALRDAADRAERPMRRADWLEAFAQHPRIGDLETLRSRFADTAAWAGAEQRGTIGASETTLRALSAGNRDYERRFGHPFIVCATGRGADEMLAMLRERLAHDPGLELEVAAGEQSRITRLRLDKLLVAETPPGGPSEAGSHPHGERT
ncbi:MAG: 2-oxo-4-hydroxy-4-carboxy-5-ureidoimidazoline decarboxylase [Candidatus Eisenbacteria bacterium]